MHSSGYAKDWKEKEKIDWLISQSLILRSSDTKAHIAVGDITRTPQLKPKQSS